MDISLPISPNVTSGLKYCGRLPFCTGRILLRLCCWFVLGLMLGNARAVDDPPGRVGRVAQVEGSGWMLHPAQGSEWFTLVPNRAFTTGDRLSSGAGARIELQVGSTSVLLGGASELVVNRLDDERVELLLQRGTLALRLRQPEQIREWRLISSEGYLAPSSTGLFRLDRDGRGTTVTVMRGEAVFGSFDSALPLTQGQRAEFWQNPGEAHTRYQWVSRPDDAFDRAAAELSNEPAAVMAAAVSPEMTGVRELERYGRWERHPEYGNVWQPASVPEGWAPYRFGRWSWVAPWGWTWIDDAPWGFAPFHYGRWVLWLGRWCWMPGAYAARPVWAPALVVWSSPPPPPLPGRPVMVVPASVGWAPLPPHDPYRPYYPASPGYVNGINRVTVHPALRPPVTVVQPSVPPPGRSAEPVMTGPRQMVPRGFQAPSAPAISGADGQPQPPRVAPVQPVGGARGVGDVRVHPALERPRPVRAPAAEAGSGRPPAPPQPGGARGDPRGANH